MCRPQWQLPHAPVQLVRLFVSQQLDMLNIEQKALCIHSAAVRTKVIWQPYHQYLLFVLQKYQDDLADLPQVNGLQSTLYSVLTVALVGAGAAYLLQPQVCQQLSLS